MARIRTLKIGFFKNEQLAEFSFAHRLLFEGLWLLADRAGRLEDRPKRIKADVFPYDDVDVSKMLQDLANGDDPFIVRYVVDGRGYIWVRKFIEHQRPHYSESESSYPPPPEQLTDTAEKSASVGEKLVTATLGKEGKGKEGKGRRGESAPHALQALWNEGTTPPIPKCLELSAPRLVSARARLVDRPLEQWPPVIARIEVSAFCRGDNDRSWTATFDWLLKPDTATRVLEGKYDDRSRNPSKPARPLRPGDPGYYEQIRDAS